MPKQKIDERKQATPPGIPIACLVAFCLVVIPSGKSMGPLAVGALDLGFWRNYRFVLVLTVVSFIVLIIAELLFKSFWRSILFSAGSISLIIEWLITVGRLKPVPWVTFLSSLPFLVIFLVGNARSLNFML